MMCKSECTCVDCPVHSEKKILEDVEKDLGPIDDVKMGEIGGSVCG